MTKATNDVPPQERPAQKVFHTFDDAQSAKIEQFTMAMRGLAELSCNELDELNQNTEARPAGRHHWPGSRGFSVARSRKGRPDAALMEGKMDGKNKGGRPRGKSDADLQAICDEISAARMLAPVEAEHQFIKAAMRFDRDSRRMNKQARLDAIRAGAEPAGSIQGDLGDSGVRVLDAIIALQDHKPDVRLIRAYSGLSEKAVRAAITRLDAAGIVVSDDFSINWDRFKDTR